MTALSVENLRLPDSAVNTLKLLTSVQPVRTSYPSCAQWTGALGPQAFDSGYRAMVALSWWREYKHTRNPIATLVVASKKQQSVLSVSRRWKRVGR